MRNGTEEINLCYKCNKQILPGEPIAVGYVIEDDSRKEVCYCQEHSSIESMLEDLVPKEMRKQILKEKKKKEKAFLKAEAALTKATWLFIFISCLPFGLVFWNHIAAKIAIILYGAIAMSFIWFSQLNRYLRERKQKERIIF